MPRKQAPRTYSPPPTCTAHQPDTHSPAQSAATPHVTAQAWLTADDVAKRLNVGKRTVYRLVQGGELPQPKKHGRASRWSLNLLLEAERRWEDASRAEQERQRNW